MPRCISEYSDFEVLTLLRGIYDADSDDFGSINLGVLTTDLYNAAGNALLSHLAYYMVTASESRLESIKIRRGVDYQLLISGCRKMLQDLCS